MQLIDQRKAFGTQAIGDAGDPRFGPGDDWSEVRIVLSSASALKANKSASLPGNRAQLTYSSSVLQELQPANDYRLLVALFNASGSMVVAQGAKEGISVSPGSNTSVPIYINAVGNIMFDHPVYQTNANFKGLGFPELLAASTVSVKTNFPWDSTSPLDQHVMKFAFELRDASGAIHIASNSATASVFTDAASASLPRHGEIPFLLMPNLPVGSPDGVYDATVFGFNGDDKVVSTKVRKVILLRGGNLNATLQ